MMKKRTKVEEYILTRLRKDVEIFLCRDLSSPSDFIFLSERIQKEGHGYISPTTLKRVWGYISDKGEEYVPSNYTLRVLCTLIGFNNWEEYCAANKTTIQSKEYKGESVNIASLPLDGTISLSWSPNRKVELRHIGCSTLEVIKNENSRLKVGDMVSCDCLTQNAPAFFRVTRADSKPFSYIAGANQGISFQLITPANTDS